MLEQKEWTTLIQLAQVNGLDEAQIKFLLALRAVERGERGSEKGYEFGIKDARGTSLEEQALWAIGSIKKNEVRHQKFILDKFKLDYKLFFIHYAGDMGSGWHSGTSKQKRDYTRKLTKALKEIELEFEEEETDKLNKP